MAKLMIKNEKNWIFVNDFESDPMDWKKRMEQAATSTNVEFTKEYLLNTEKRLKKYFFENNKFFSFCFLCGSDVLFNHFGIENLEKIDFSVISIERPKFELNNNKSNKNIEIIKISNSDFTDFSSTGIRKLIEEKKSIEGRTSKEIEDYMKEI